MLDEIDELGDEARALLRVPAGKNTIRSVTPCSLGAVNEAAGVEEAVIQGREGVADALRTRILSASPSLVTLSAKPFAPLIEPRH